MTASSLLSSRSASLGTSFFHGLPCLMSDLMRVADSSFRSCQGGTTVIIPRDLKIDLTQALPEKTASMRGTLPVMYANHASSSMKSGTFM